MRLTSRLFHWFQRRGFHYLLILLCNLSTITIFSYGMNWGLSTSSLLIIGVGITFLIGSLRENYRRKITWIITPCSILLVFLINWWMPLTFFKQTNQLLQWLPSIITRTIPENCRLAFLFWLMIPLCILWSWLLSYRMIRRLLLPASLTLLILFGFWSYNQTRLLPLCLIAILLISFYEEIRYSVPQITFLIPCVLSLVLIISILPSSSKPISWKYVRFAYHQLADYATEISDFLGVFGSGGSKDFGVTMTGYSEDSELSGDVSDDDSVFLRAYLPTRPRNPLYLAGCYRNTFTGSRWEETSSLPGKEEATLDYWERIYSIVRQKTWFDTTALYRTRQVGITYQETSTRSIFYPALLEDVSHPKGTLTYQKGGNMRFSKTQREGTSYYLHYLEFNEGCKAYKDYIASQSQYTYEPNRVISPSEREDFVSHFYAASVKIPDNLEELLAKRRDRIYKDYLSIPDSISDDVRELAATITDGKETTYEKLHAIEYYLSTNYDYSTSPGMPEDENKLIDYFLLENKEGYCTYFASAFAILGRCVGIPTRYVQGFLCNYDYHDAGAYYHIYGSDAHAWPEAYVEGIGWMSFEPTASYTDARYQEWQFTESFVGTPSDSGPKHVAPAAKLTDTVLTRNNRFLNIGMRNIKPSRTLIRVLILFGIIAVLVLIGLLLYLVQSIRHTRKMYRLMDDGRKYWQDYKALLYLLNTLGHRKEPGETMREYCERIRLHWTELPVSLTRLTACHEAFCYHGIAPSPEDRKAIQITICELASQIRKKRGWLRYQFFVLRSGIVITN